MLKIQTEKNSNFLASNSKPRNTDLTDSREVVVGLFDGLFTDVRPEYQALREEKVHCGRILKITDNHGGLRPACLCVHQPDVPPVSKEQQGRTWRQKLDVTKNMGKISFHLIKSSSKNEEQTITFS